MKTKTNVKAGRKANVNFNENENAISGLRVQTNVKAGKRFA